MAVNYLNVTTKSVDTQSKSVIVLTSHQRSLKGSRVNKHLAKMQPGTRLILALIVLGLEFLLIQFNLSTFIPTVLIVIVASILLEYKVVHKFLYSAKNKAGRLKQKELGVRISRFLSGGSMVILTLAHLESTPDQVAEFQLLGHLFYCAGTILWIAYLMGYNRMNS